MEYLFIQTPEELQTWCEYLRDCRAVGLDTEFVGDWSYQPELCLVQVEAEGRLALLDPLAVHLNPFWEVLVSGDRETIVHGGARDIWFCYHAVGKVPVGLVDVQIAGGFLGIEYPAGFSTLMERVLGRCFSKTETRTDWRHRPLSARQIEYALEDVRYLRELWGVLRAQLESRGRLRWFWEEMQRWQQEVIKKMQEEGWRRLPGQGSLSRRGLAILRELWQWRDRQAQRRNRPPRVVLRDDLLVELARRETANIHRIRAVRGLEQPAVQRHLPQIAACIQRALQLPEDQLPLPSSTSRVCVSAILNQFFYAALATRCRQLEVAPSLVGTPQDLRDWIAYRLGWTNTPEVPLLAQGWRAELLGSILDDLLMGRLALRIQDPESELPLEMIRIEEQIFPHSQPPTESSPSAGQPSQLQESSPPEKKENLPSQNF